MGVITKYVKNINFHTTLINFIYQFKIDKDEIMAYTILSKLLTYTNGIYKEENDFAKEKLLRYIMNYKCSGQAINDVYFINFSLLIPSSNVVKEDYIEDAITFVLDCIYKPNINNNLFNEKLFDREKRLYIENLLNGYKNVGFVAEKNALDILDSEGIFNKLKYKDLDNINNLKNSDVVNFYNKYIKNYMPKIFINGNVDEKRIELIINNYINDLKLKKYKVIDKYNHYLNIEFVDKTDESNFYQSIVYMAYNVKNYSEEDKYKLYLINLLLNSSSSDLLMQHLRKQNNLVYSSGSSALLNNGLLIIKGVTSKNNVKMVKLVIKDIIEKIKNIDDYCINISNIMYRLGLNLEREKDDFFIKSSDVINSYFKCDISSEEEFEVLNNIEKEELIDVINRLNLIGVYTLEGNRE